MFCKSFHYSRSGCATPMCFNFGEPIILVASISCYYL